MGYNFVIVYLRLWVYNKEIFYLSTNLFFCLKFFKGEKILERLGRARILHIFFSLLLLTEKNEGISKHCKNRAYLSHSNRALEKFALESKSRRLSKGG